MKTEEKREKIEYLLQEIEKLIGKPKCEECESKCCLVHGFGEKAGPVVDKVFGQKIPKEKIKKVGLPFFKVPVLKTENGSCVYFDEETGKCTNYENRPLECRLYPIQVIFNKRGVSINVHQCPGISHTEESKEEVMKYVSQILKLDKDFINKKRTLENYKNIWAF